MIYNTNQITRSAVNETNWSHACIYNLLCAMARNLQITMHTNVKIKNTFF